MTVSTTPAKAYVLSGCPFCFKMILFMTEAGLLDQMEIHSLDRDAADYEAQKQALTEHARMDVSFPMVELEPGKFLKDSDAIIAYFAGKNGVDPDALPILDIYKKGLFIRMRQLFMENRELKQKYGV